ncbi:sugar-binding transcriptional regulator [Fictibacillus sp. WQ 8-8]|uniref:sugar-binding transcriptional regulator n=1 Tax=unclassified Fictibacillus TaxID=2644029 RepID=UPI0008EBD4E7|nr:MULTISPECIES: sugar-binding transcriptional regulator [unclassified Fictibacillus]MCQ6268712.1 sugar-binding transcriptional regulator [Fictibacillus sp. WQ 8-8]UZJ78514.1 sugar-binding transcriptional regulator [Fictibacillus sp. KU28468]SFE69628.1 deoxyribonucleoside regulator [Bacillus sp. OV194]
MEQEKLKKVIEAAKLYYLLDYNQNQIAAELGISRPTVSRLLQQAKTEGIVQIKIMDPTNGIEQLASELEEKFNLKKAIVASIPQYESTSIKKGLGEKAAEYLYEIVKDGDRIGVTWGTTLYNVACQLKQKFVKDVKVVQLKGGISHSETNTYHSEILDLFGKAFNTVPTHLPLPAIVDHVVVKQAMEADRHIKRILDMGKDANIALFTIGPVKSESLLFQLGYFSEEDLKHIHSKAAGDICSRFIDEEGEILNASLNERTLGIDLKDLKQKEHSILVAGGQQKIDGIYGALKGGYANVLVTDQFTARFLLDKEE